MAKLRVMQTMPHDSTATLCFLMPNFLAKFEWDHLVLKARPRPRTNMPWLGVAMINLVTKFEVSTLTHYEYTKDNA